MAIASAQRELLLSLASVPSTSSAPSAFEQNFLRINEQVEQLFERLETATKEQRAQADAFSAERSFADASLARAFDTKNVLAKELEQLLKRDNKAKKVLEKTRVDDAPKSKRCRTSAAPEDSTSAHITHHSVYLLRSEEHTSELQSPC